MELATPAVNAPTKEALQVETVLPGKEIQAKHLSILDKHLYESVARTQDIFQIWTKYLGQQQKRPNI